MIDNMIMCAKCEDSRATMYCVNDDAYLCQVCDEEHHANPLGAKHVRQRIDTVYKTQVSGTSFDDVAVVPQLGGQDDLFSSDVLFPEVDMPSMKTEDLGQFDDLFSCLPDDAAFGVVPQSTDMVPQAPNMVPQNNVFIKSSKMSQHDVMPEMNEEHVMVPQMVPCLEGEVEPLAFIDVDAPVVEEKEEEEMRGEKRRRAVHGAYNDDDDFEYSSFLEDEEDDNDDADFYVTPRRVGSRSRRLTRRTMTNHQNAQHLSAHMVEEPELTREERVARYRAKRARRCFQKTIRYQSRKAYAEIRPRIKGRFVSHEEYAEYMAQKQQEEQQQEAVVPGSC